MRERIRGLLSPRAASWVAVGVWVLLILGVFGRVAYSRPEKGSVVPIYLTAGERWANGEPLYGVVPGLDLYRNPPGVAALFAPLTLLDPKLAAILWRAACLGVYAVGVRRLIGDVLPPVGEWARCGLWVVSGVLALPAFNNGQINLLIVGTAVCGVTAAVRGKWWEAAAWLAGCGWLKVYPFAVGMLACLFAPRQLSWRLIVASVVLFGLPFVCQHPAYVWDRHTEFVTETAADDRSDAELVRAPRDWTILARTWIGVAVPRSVAMGTALTAAALFAGLVWMNRSSPRTAGLLALSLGLVWLTLFGPRTEANTYAMLAPVAAAVAVCLPPLGRRVGWVACGCLVSAIIRAAFGGDGPFNATGVQAVGATLLTGVLVVWGVRTWRSELRDRQRNGRDLNPRYGDTVYGISSAASSAARAPFRMTNRRRQGPAGSPSASSYHPAGQRQPAESAPGSADFS
jgi:hypothetical protein